MHEIKKIVVLACICITSIVAVSCGKEGTASLALSWVAINSIGGFSALPPTLVADVYYPHPAGSYSGWYTSFDLSYWTVVYTITVNSGGFSDGAPKYFKIFLYSSGPSMYEYADPLLQGAFDEHNDTARTADMTSNSNASNRIQTYAGDIDLSAYDLTVPVTNFVIEGTAGGRYIKVHYTQFRKKK